jgi:hypothetical protein
VARTVIAANGPWLETAHTERCQVARAACRRVILRRTFRRTFASCLMSRYSAGSPRSEVQRLPYSVSTGILLLAAVAGRASDLAGDDPREYVARMLWVVGWVSRTARK